jgi:hypothetical protein
LGDITGGTHMVKANALTFWNLSKMVLDSSSPPSAWLCYTWALAHEGEYAQVVHPMVPNIWIVPSNETMASLRLFHLSIEVKPQRQMLL